MIVPVQTEYLSLRGLVQLENTLQMVRENLNPEVEIIGILPTMYDRRLTHSREADEILRENFGELVYNTRIRKTIRYAEAPVKGVVRAGLRARRRGRRRSTATWRRRCSMARKRASMREGPLAELFRATEAAQRSGEPRGEAARRSRADGEPAEPGAGRAPPPEPAPTRVELAARARRRARPSPAARWLEPLPENPARLERAARAAPRTSP